MSGWGWRVGVGKALSVLSCPLPTGWCQGTLGEMRDGWVGSSDSWNATGSQELISGLRD